MEREQMWLRIILTSGSTNRQSVTDMTYFSTNVYVFLHLNGYNYNSIIFHTK
jgi:hypothetical protein